MIKWTKGRNLKLRKAINRYNAKVEREIKKNPELKNTTVSKWRTKDLKERIDSVNDLNVILRELDRAFAKGAFDVTYTAEGFPITNYEKQNVKYQVRRINKRRAEKREEIPDNLEYYGTAEVVRKQILQDRKVPNFEELKWEQWIKIAASLKEQDRDEYLKNIDGQYKDNYLKAIREIFGSAGDNLKKIVSQVPASVLVQNMYTSYEATIDYVYAPEAMSAKIEYLENFWSGFVT